MGRVGIVRPSLETLAAQWATPTSHPRTHTPREVDHGEQLANQVNVWATPSAHDGRRPGSDATSTQGANLKRDAEAWATPQSRDWKDSSSVDFPETLTGPPLGRQAPRSGIGGPPSSPAGPSSPPLRIACGCGAVFYGELGTPCPACGLVRDAEVTYPPERGGASEFQKQVRIVTGKKRLSVLFVTWLMNLPLGWVDLAPLDSTNFVRWETQSCRWLQPTPS